MLSHLKSAANIEYMLVQHQHPKIIDPTHCHQHCDTSCLHCGRGWVQVVGGSLTGWLRGRTSALTGHLSICRVSKVTWGHYFVSVRPPENFLPSTELHQIRVRWHLCDTEKKSPTMQCLINTNVSWNLLCVTSGVPPTKTHWIFSHPGTSISSNSKNMENNPFFLQIIF